MVKKLQPETESEVEFEFNLTDLREQLGIDELVAENKYLRELLGEILTYLNMVDLTVQELVGEPSVTERIKYNIPKGGRLQVQRERPPVPSNLAADELSILQKREE